MEPTLFLCWRFVHVDLTLEPRPSPVPGKGGGWGITLPYHTLDVTVGGIAEKPGVVGEKIAIREYLDVTVSFDHDVIDGAPAARFVTRLNALIEQGYGLLDHDLLHQDEETLSTV